LPPLWSRQILLICKEALTNTFKHAEAKNVIVSFVIFHRQLKVSIIDDGKGFNYETLDRKNGIHNISYRAKRINAIVNITSNDRGTTIELLTNSIV
jgi:signal transduction histidine kinase